MSACRTKLREGREGGLSRRRKEGEIEFLPFLLLSSRTRSFPKANVYLSELHVIPFHMEKRLKSEVEPESNYVPFLITSVLPVPPPANFKQTKRARCIIESCI